jgi:glycosyltransferase involved in cell wall biosynthesis
VDGSIAIVAPRFGPDVVGGAEAVLAEAARGLAHRGHDVELLTTCAIDHFTWANHHRPGVEHQAGITVRRFPTITDTAGVHRERIGARILAGEPVDLREQQLWVNDSLRVPDLWHHVLDHADRYRALVFAPYMFWTTYAVAQIAPAKTILMPCLHDEPTARLEIFSTLIEGARGIWFLSEPEAELARHLYDLPSQQAVVGSGIEVPTRYEPERFRTAYGIDGPFLYYAGRREWGKGWFELVEAFGELVRTHLTDLLLVTSGAGEIEVPADLTHRIVDLGFLPDDQRDNAMAAATAYVQPSAMESFSRTVLEAWAAGAMVVANAQSDVVRWHVERSGAGITYRGRAELVETLRFVADEPEACARLALPGRRYVEEGFRWPDVLDRMEQTLDQWVPARWAGHVTEEGP